MKRYNINDIGISKLRFTVNTNQLLFCLAGLIIIKWFLTEIILDI